MRYRIIIISSILVCIVFLFSIYFGFQYYHHSNFKHEKEEIDQLIQNICNERERNEKQSKQLEEMKNSQKDKSNLLEVWLRESEKLKN